MQIVLVFRYHKISFFLLPAAEEINYLLELLLSKLKMRFHLFVEIGPHCAPHTPGHWEIHEHSRPSHQFSQLI